MVFETKMGVGMVGSCLSLATANSDLVDNTLVEGGAYACLVGFLLFTTRTLWSRLKERDKEVKDLNDQIQTNWKEQLTRTEDVMDKLANELKARREEREER